MIYLRRESLKKSVGEGEGKGKGRGEGEVGKNLAIEKNLLKKIYLYPGNFVGGWIVLYEYEY